jgi:membrane fusion protein (multidrug efflux system)
MKRIRTVSSPVLLAGVLSLAACGGEPEADAPADSAVDTRRIINVQVETLQRRDFHDVIRLTGTVVADREVTLSAEEAGTIEELLADKGDAVAAGQVLMRLDDDLLRAQRDEAKAQADLAQQLWERVRRLYEEDGIGTENGYYEARYAADAAKARRDLAEERLTRATIRAPFAGTLDSRLVEVGSVVSPGQAVGVIVDTEPLKVSAGVPERYAADVMPGAAAQVHFKDLATQAAASVRFVGARVHPGNRTFPVELSLEHPVAAAKPEMVADIVLSRRLVPDVVVVPRQTLVRTEEGFTAFVVEGPGNELHAAARAVELGPSGRDEVVVTSGLQAGDRLVVIGQNQIAAGDLVRIVSDR